MKVFEKNIINSQKISNTFYRNGVFSVILSSISVGTSLSGFGLIVGLPLGTIGGCCGLVSVGTGIFSKKLNKNFQNTQK